MGTVPGANGGAGPGDGPVYLPISAVAELIYCPRNFYYRVVEGAEDENEHVVQGRLQEEARDERATLSRPGAVQHRGELVSSERLRLIGKIDVVEERGEVYPVEYKKGAAGVKLHDQVQLCAQGMVLEDVLGRPVHRGFLYYAESGTRVPVEFTEDLRALVMDTVERAIRIVESGIIPEPVADERCRGCSLQARCLPAEVRFLQGTGPAPVRPVPAVNLGRVLYVDEPGAYVRKVGERLAVTKDEVTLREVPVVNLDEVVLVGSANLSASAARLLLEHRIPVALISSRGDFEGWIQPAFGKNAPLRIAQVCRHLDPAFRLEVAKQFVLGKLANMRTVVLRHSRHREDPDLAAAAEELAAAQRQVPGATNRNELMGIEGQGTRAYLAALARMLRPDLPFHFERRTRRPPEDPVNALMSLAYTLLTGRPWRPARRRASTRTWGSCTSPSMAGPPWPSI